AMPDFVGTFGQGQAAQFLAAVFIKDAEFDAGGVGRENREVDAQPVAGCAQRVGRARAQPVRGVVDHDHPSCLSSSVDSGGRVSVMDCSCPCADASCVSTSTGPSMPVPPYAASSVLSRARQRPAFGTPMRYSW